MEYRHNEVDDRLNTMPPPWGHILLAVGERNGEIPKEPGEKIWACCSWLGKKNRESSALTQFRDNGVSFC